MDGVAIRRLGAEDVATMRALNMVFADAFEDASAYADPPSDGYLADALDDPKTVVLVAEAGGAVMGGLVAYVLVKLERARSEVYIYDLAVAEPWRRRGVASALIAALKPHAQAAGAWVMFVQADRGDEPAIALYSGLGAREDPHHFDIPVD